MTNPSDPTVFVSKVAAGIFIEIFKECLKDAEGLGEWVKQRDLLGTAARRYANQIKYRYNTMRVMGMDEPVPLMDIYIRARILKGTTAGRWRTLEDLEADFRERDSRAFGISKETKTGIEVANELPKFILLGKPGSGKTTFLKYIALQAMGGELTEKLIPIFIELKYFNDSAGKSLMDFIVEQFDICQFPDAGPFIERVLGKGRCVLLLDGLDEVSKKERKRVIREIRNFSDKYNKNHFVLSCRVGAYNDYFEKFTNVELADFTDEQIHGFINNWFGEGSKKAQSCWSKFRENKPIKELASVPLLLTLFCIAFDENMEFPRNRAELYRNAIDALLKKWDAHRSIDRDKIYKNLSNRGKETMFSRIAMKAFEKDQFFLPRATIEKQIADFIENLQEADPETLEPDSEAILKAIEAQHGIFVERAKGIYSFSHLTVQEYFTARYIVDNVTKGTLEWLIDNHLTNDRWREVLLITAGMLAEADDFLLTMKKRIDVLLENAKLAKFMTEIQDNIVKKDSPYPPPFSRALAVWYILNRALDLDRVLDRDRVLDLAFDLTCILALDRALALALTLGIDLDRDLDRVLDRARALDLDSDLMKLLDIYLRANQLCVDCLNTECYISKDTRRKILEELLTVPR